MLISNFKNFFVERLLILNYLIGYLCTLKKMKNTEIPVKSREFALQLINVPGISETKALKIIE